MLLFFSVLLLCGRDVPAIVLINHVFLPCYSTDTVLSLVYFLLLLLFLSGLLLPRFPVDASFPLVFIAIQ